VTYILHRSDGTSHCRRHSMHSSTWVLCWEAGSAIRVGYEKRGRPLSDVEILHDEGRGFLTHLR
jgi:hypothetical protein